MDEWARPGQPDDPWRPPSGPPLPGPPPAPPGYPTLPSAPSGYPPRGPYPIAYPGPPPPGPGGMMPYPGMPQPVRTPPDMDRPQLVAVREVPGTPYGLMIMGVTPTVSGPGVGALVAGVGSILVTMIELCFGLLGASGGWGPAVAGAFAVLAGALAIGAITLGSVSLRQIRRARETGGMRGRGQALGGIVCGSVGLALDLGAIALAVLIAG